VSRPHALRLGTSVISTSLMLLIAVIPSPVSPIMCWWRR